MAKEKNQKSMEETLWESANKLRGSVESSEYKHIVLGLIFLKFVSDTFEERREKLLAEGKEAFIDMVEFYTMENVFYLPEISRWSYIKQNAKQDDIALKIDTALATIEKNTGKEIQALKKKIDQMTITLALKCYVQWSIVRLGILEVAIVTNLLCYYLTLSTTGNLCMLIGLTASLFCLPGEKRLRNELHITKD